MVRGDPHLAGIKAQALAGSGDGLLEMAIEQLDPSKAAVDAGQISLCLVVVLALGQLLCHCEAALVSLESPQLVARIEQSAAHPAILKEQVPTELFVLLGKGLGLGQAFLKDFAPRLGGLCVFSLKRSWPSSV